MAELLETTPQNITSHFKNIYSTWELSEPWTCKDFLQVQKEWSRKVKRTTKHYNLKAIIAVWYRVNSYIATEFRKRATNTLHQYIIKWYVLDNERLKETKHFGKDYYDHLIQEIREIRSREIRL
jgi:hypothetical protein